MDRRNFLGLASFAGLAVASFDALGRPARPGSRGGRTPLSQAYRGPLYITINAAGGWDPTSLCDPKGAASDVDPDAMNWSYRSRDIGTTASGIRYAPLGSADRRESFQRFFEKHDRRLLVLNGVDVGTRGHAEGTRHLWSGRLAEGYPSLPALIAGVHGRDLAMSYLSFGGHDETQGAVARVRGGLPVPGRAANPDRDPDGGPTLFDPAGEATGVLYASRTGVDELRRLQRHMPELDHGDNPLIRQIQVALAAYRAGVTVAVNLELDGFDTHDDHDARHIPRLCQLLAGLDFLGDEAARQDIGDDYVVVVGSDFGRTPGYNAGNGKDHWPVTSVMAMGKGITGGRVLGATSERHERVPGGVHITPGRIHHDLRRLAGIDGDDLVQCYPLTADTGDEVNLFT